jgi:hypothetical protein
MLKSVEHKEPVNRKTTDAEVITVILLAAAYFGGNIETSIFCPLCRHDAPHVE